MPTVKATLLDDRLDEIAALPVCVLLGEDGILLERSVHLLERTAAPPDQPGSTARRFEGEVAAHEVFDELRTVPFLGLPGRRSVVVEDGAAFLKACGEQLTAYLAAPSTTATLILCVPRMDRRTRVARAIAARGAVVDCSRPTWSEAREWLQAEAARRGKRLSRGAVPALMDAVGGNLLALRSELDKLAAYCGEDEVITEEAVAEVVPQARSRTVFDLFNALAAGQAADAFRLCRQLTSRREAPELIVAMLARQVRRLWQVKRLQGQGRSPRDIARDMGMQDWMVRQARQASERLSDEWFVRALKLLADADYESKTTSLRAAGGEIWLESLAARLSQR